MNQISFNTKQASQYLNDTYGLPVTPGTLEVWRSLGRGPRYNKVTRWVIYQRVDLDKFAEGRTIETMDSVGSTR